MPLYCAPTPPLIAGNKVCTGASRVGHGCDDTLGTGVCANQPLDHCQAACRRNHLCEMFVFYPEEKQGTWCAPSPPPSPRSRERRRSQGGRHGAVARPPRSHHLPPPARAAVATHRPAPVARAGSQLASPPRRSVLCRDLAM